MNHKKENNVRCCVIYYQQLTHKMTLVKTHEQRKTQKIHYSVSTTSQMLLKAISLNKL